MAIKRCVVCEKKFLAVPRNKKTCSGKCKEKRTRENNHAWKAAHPEKKIEYDCKYRAANREKRVEDDRRDRTAHPEKYRERQRRRRMADPEKYRERGRLYYAKLTAALQLLKEQIGTLPTLEL